jgi:beta-ketoacyl-acyl-carrier-protein synthase II
MAVKDASLKTTTLHRVVVTGMGAITPIGLTVDDFFANLIAGVSGAAPITQFDASAYPTRIAAEVKGFEVTNYVEAREARRMSRFIQFAVAAARDAMAQAQLNMDGADRHRAGVILGTGIGSFTTVDKEVRVMLEKGGMRINPFFLPMMLPNMAAAHVGRIFGFKGFNTTTATACASGAQAIGDASNVLRHGMADVMIAGGSDSSVCEFALASFCVMRALTTRNEDPAGASRPFDKNRDGFLPAEGAAVMLLETLEHALQRGAPILAEVMGFGSTCDAYHVVAPHPEGEGMAKSMELALQQGGLKPEDIGYINAHGTSTDLNDKTETLAIKKVFGQRAYHIPISSTKSMVGHLIGAAGPTEAVAVIKTLNEGVIHPTINYTTPDPDCDLDYVPNVARRMEVRAAISNSFGFGGQNASLAFRRYSE